MASIDMLQRMSEAVGELPASYKAGQIGTLGSGDHYLEIQVVRPENMIDSTLGSALASPSRTRWW